MRRAEWNRILDIIGNAGCTCQIVLCIGTKPDYVVLSIIFSASIASVKDLTGMILMPGVPAISW